MRIKAMHVWYFWRREVTAPCRNLKSFIGLLGHSAFISLLGLKDDDVKEWVVEPQLLVTIAPKFLLFQSSAMALEHYSSAVALSRAKLHRAKQQSAMRLCHMEGDGDSLEGALAFNDVAF